MKIYFEGEVDEFLDLFKSNLDEILDHIESKGEEINMTLDQLQQKVQRNTEVSASAVTLIQGIAQQLRDAQGNPALIAQLADQLDQSANTLAEAVTANTPSANA